MSNEPSNFSIGDLLGAFNIDALEEQFGELPIDALSLREASTLIKTKQTIIRSWEHQGKIKNIGTEVDPLFERYELQAVSRTERLRLQVEAKSASKSKPLKRVKAAEPSQTKAKLKKRNFNTSKRPEELLTIPHIARILNVKVEVISLCVKRGLVPSFSGSKDGPRVRLSSFTAKDFDIKLSAIQKEVNERSKASKGIQARSQPRPSFQRNTDTEKLVVPAMLKRLAEIEALIGTNSSLYGERSYLRSEVRRRDPEAFKEYLTSTK